MPSSSVLLLFSAAFSTTLAIPWTGPRPTATYAAADWTPRPTQGAFREDQLFRRDWFFSSDICGWIEGNYSKSITCATSSSCVWDTARSFVGCCMESAACSTGVYTGCVDSMNGQQTVVDPAVTTCSGASVCYLNSFPQGYHQYECGSSKMAATVETTFFDQPASFFLQIATTSLNIPAPSIIAGAVSTSGASGTAGSQPTSHSSKPPIGAIIGGVIGGIVVIIGLTVLIGYIIRNRKDYHRRRPALNNSRSAKSSPKGSDSEKAPPSNADFHRLSNGAASPTPNAEPEMGIVKTLTFPPPPESHKNPPAPRYFSENDSPARSPWSPIAHVPPRFSSIRKASPVPYIQNYIPRPKTPHTLAGIVSPAAYEPMRFSPKALSPIAFTPIQESQREGQLIPVTPGLQQTTEMSPVAFLPSDTENDSDTLEPRRMSPVAYLPRTGAQSPSDNRNLVTPSPSNQSTMQESGSGRDLITPSPSGSQQPLLQSQNSISNRQLKTPSPAFQLPTEPVELPGVELPMSVPMPIKTKSPSKGRHNKNSSSASSKSVRYTPIPPLQATPPRDMRKPISKFADPTDPESNRTAKSNNHIAHQLAGAYSTLKTKTSQQSIALNNKSSQQSLAPKNSIQSLRQKNSVQSLRPNPSRTEINTNIAVRAGSALVGARAVSPEEREDIAARFRPMQSSHKNISSAEYEQAITGGRKGSLGKIERLLGLESVGKPFSNPKNSQRAKKEKMYTGVPGTLEAASIDSAYEEELYLRDQHQKKLDDEYKRRETASVCSATILDVGSEGMGTLPFTMQLDDIPHDYQEDHGNIGAELGRQSSRKDKGVKWRDEVATDGEIAQLRGDTPRIAEMRRANDEVFGEWGWLDSSRGEPESAVNAMIPGQQAWFQDDYEDARDSSRGGWL